MNVIEINGVFHCDCGFSWMRGENGSHDCGKGLREKIRQLAAENVLVRERHRFIRALAVSILEHSGGRHDWRGAMEDASDLVKTVDEVYSNTPATDRIVAGIKADGVEVFALMFAEEAIKDNNITTGWKARASRAASEYAELLREEAGK